MRKTYEPPVAKLYNIRAEERVASSCIYHHTTSHVGQGCETSPYSTNCGWWEGQNS